MDDHRTYLSIFLISLISFLFSSHAYQFNVGGRDGWVVNPSENYNNWAGRMRFQVNDTLFFKYKKGSNSVLVVNKDDYNNCNIDKPITKLEDGNSIFKFDRSGPFFFISGNKENCDKGQKIIIVVLAVRTPPKAPVPPAGKPPAISPISPSPAANPPSTALTPSGSPGLSPSTSPAPAGSPGLSPSSAPAPAGSPSLSPSNAPAPAGSPSLSPSATPSPAGAPSLSPSISTPSPSSVTSPPPPSPPSSNTPGSPGLSPPGTVAPTTNSTPADVNSPPGSSARPAFTAPSTVLTSTVSLLVLSLTLGASVISL